MMHIRGIIRGKYSRYLWAMSRYPFHGIFTRIVTHDLPHEKVGKSTTFNEKILKNSGPKINKLQQSA
jgi:hypothetical protein